MKYSKRKKILEDLQEKVDSLKTLRIIIRMSLSEYDKAKALAEKNKMNLSEWIRHAAITPK